MEQKEFLDKQHEFIQKKPEQIIKIYKVYSVFSQDEKEEKNNYEIKWYHKWNYQHARISETLSLRIHIPVLLTCNLQTETMDGQIILAGTIGLIQSWGGMEEQFPVVFFPNLQMACLIEPLSAIWTLQNSTSKHIQLPLECIPCSLHIQDCIGLDLSPVEIKNCQQTPFLNYTLQTRNKSSVSDMNKKKISFPTNIETYYKQMDQFAQISHYCQETVTQEIVKKIQPAFKKSLEGRTPCLDL